MRAHAQAHCACTGTLRARRTAQQMYCVTGARLHPLYLDDQFLEYFVEHAEEIIKDFEDELSEEEVKEFKVEHGLIEEDEA